MCICINCRHTDICYIYDFINKQHGNAYFNHIQKSFHPNDTVVYVSINKSQKQILLDWDLKECKSFVEEPGNWLCYKKINLDRC